MESVTVALTRPSLSVFVLQLKIVPLSPCIAETFSVSLPNAKVISMPLASRSQVVVLSFSSWAAEELMSRAKPRGAGEESDHLRNLLKW